MHRHPPRDPEPPFDYGSINPGPGLTFWEVFRTDVDSRVLLCRREWQARIVCSMLKWVWKNWR